MTTHILAFVICAPLAIATQLVSSAGPGWSTLPLTWAP